MRQAGLPKAIGRLGTVAPALVTLTLIALAPGASAAATCPGHEADPRPQLVGTEGPDLLVGSSADEVICGLGGPDRIFAETGNDRLDGGPGSDVLNPGFGSDVVSGATGYSPDPVFLPNDPSDRREIDTVFYGGTYGQELQIRTAGVVVTLDGLPGDGGPGENDWLMGDVESVEGGTADDLLIGNKGDNWLVGWQGNDRLIGGGGHDSLLGFEGRDVINARDGTDHADPSGVAGRAINVGAEDDWFECDRHPWNGDLGDVAIVDWDDISLEPDHCETLIEPGAPLLGDGGEDVTVPVTCTGVRRCHGYVAVRLRAAGGLVTGKETFSFKPRRKVRRLRIPLQLARGTAVRSSAVIARKRGMRNSVVLKGQHGALALSRRHAVRFRK